MWRQIGIKDFSSDRSLSQVSNASTERRYSRRRPYNQSDSIDYVQNQFSRMDYFDDKDKQKQALESKISSKKDKELTSFLDKNQQFRKTTSLLKINSEFSDPMYNSMHINNLFRSGSLKAHQNVESLTNLKQRKESDNNSKLNESLVVQYEGLYEQINRLNLELKKERSMNCILIQKLNEYKREYQQIDIFIKEQLFDYFRMQKDYFNDIENIMNIISHRSDQYRNDQHRSQQDVYVPQNKPMSKFIPEFHSLENLGFPMSLSNNFKGSRTPKSPKSPQSNIKPKNTKNSSISLILGTIQQMKNRILEKTIIQVSSPKSSHGGCYSPRSDKKRSILPAVAEFEQLMNR